MSLLQAQQPLPYSSYVTTPQMAYKPTAPVAVPPSDSLYLPAEEDGSVNGQSSVKVITKEKNLGENRSTWGEEEKDTVIVEQCPEKEPDKDKHAKSPTNKKASALRPGCEWQCYDNGVDSGCASDNSSGPEGCLATEDCCDAPLPPLIPDLHSENSDSPSNTSDSHSDNSSQHSISNRSDISSSSDTGLQVVTQYRVPYRNRYNSPGQIKLMKPLKDIPPRFQKMLSCNPAIRQEQFEGQPIMRQSYTTRPKSVTVSASTLAECTSQHNFNPNAQSFVPRQPNNYGTSQETPCMMTNPNSQCSDNRECSTDTSRDAYYSGNMPDDMSTGESAQSVHAPVYTIQIFRSSIDGSLSACCPSNVAPSVSVAPTGCYGEYGAAMPPYPSTPTGAAPGVVYYCQQQGVYHPPPQNFSPGTSYTQPPPAPAPSNQHIVYTSNPSITYNPYQPQQSQYQYT